MRASRKWVKIFFSLSAGPDSRIWLGGAREGGATGHEAAAQKAGGSVLCDEVKLGNTGTHVSRCMDRPEDCSAALRVGSFS